MWVWFWIGSVAFTVGVIYVAVALGVANNARDDLDKGNE